MKKLNNNRSYVRIENAQILGILFLLVFIVYGFGRYLFESEIVYKKNIGSMLIVMNSVMVLCIGILLRKSLKHYNAMVGNIYLLARIFEAIALASIVLNLIPTIRVSYDYGYFLAMLGLGLGSIPMCLTFYMQKILPSGLALLGVIGYAVFTFGFLMELAGKESSMYFLILGGLWEIIFALWLIIKK